MNNIVLAFALFTVSVTSVANAQTTRPAICEQLLLNFNETIILTPSDIPTNITYSGLDQFQYKQVLTDTINGINEVMGPLRVTQVAVKAIPGSVTGSRFDTPSVTMEIGTDPADSSANFQTVLTHEFFHGVLNEHLLLHFNGGLYKLSDIYAKFDPLEVTIKPFDVSLDPSQVTPDIQKVRNMIMTVAMFHELFADIGIIIFLKDPRLLTNTLGAKSAADGPSADLNPRDFYDVLNFKKWSYGSPDPHNTLDPVRDPLWRLFLKNLKDSDRQKFMLSCMEAIDDYLSALGDLGVTVQTPPTSEKLNQDVLELIVQRVRSNGIPIQK